jgi:hypothetical protein
MSSAGRCSLLLLLLLLMRTVALPVAGPTRNMPKASRCTKLAAWEGMTVVEYAVAATAAATPSARPCGHATRECATQPDEHGQQRSTATQLMPVLSTSTTLNQDSRTCIVGKHAVVNHSQPRPAAFGGGQ